MGEKKKEEDKTRKFITVKPGELGVVINQEDGKIVMYHPQVQECFKNMDPGWIIASIDGKPFNSGLLDKKIDGDVSYVLEMKLLLNNLENQRKKKEVWRKIADEKKKKKKKSWEKNCEKKKKKKKKKK